MRHSHRIPTRRPLRHRAFTLIEMIAVLVIIGLILTIGIPQIGNAIERGRVTSAEGQTQQMYNAIERFNMDVGRYPTDDEGLMAILERPAEAEGWAGPYMRTWTTIPKDPWNNEYQYTVITDEETGTETPKVICLGRGGKPGGTGFAADIINGQAVEDEGGED